MDGYHRGAAAASEIELTRELVSQTFCDLSVVVQGAGFSHFLTDLLVDLCYAQRDLQLWRLGFKPGPPRPLNRLGGMS